MHKWGICVKEGKLSDMINVFVLLTGLVVKIKGSQVTNPIKSLSIVYIIIR